MDISILHQNIPNKYKDKIPERETAENIPSLVCI